MTPKNKDFPLIHEVQVTDENLSDLLHTEIFRLMHRYGPGIRDEIYALALGPNAFKCFEEWHRKRQTFSSDWTDAPRFHGIRIVCGPLPFVVPLFTERGWYYAHEEAKRIVDLTDGVDA